MKDCRTPDICNKKVFRGSWDCDACGESVCANCNAVPRGDTWLCQTCGKKQEEPR